METTPQILAYGGGLDSFTLLVEAIRRGERLDAVVFCDVGDPQGVDPGEWPGTYRHIREVAMPLCERAGVAFHWLDTERYPVRGARSLFAWLWERQQIYVAGPNRLCTIIAKVERFERWLDESYPNREVEVWVGFDAAEQARADKDPNAGNRRKHRPGQARRRNRFPLMEWGLCRCRCESLVRAAGHPVPRKSACMACPYASKGDWQAFAASSPAHFARVVELEVRKPPTKKGKKLSIMGFRTLKDGEGQAIGYKAPPLPVWIQGAYRVQQKPCSVCGAPVKASKATGCGYLDEPATQVAA